MAEYVLHKPYLKEAIKLHENCNPSSLDAFQLRLNCIGRYKAILFW